MGLALSCPRCSCTVRAPSAWSSAYQCDQHGDVLPLRSGITPSEDGLGAVLADAQVPVWLPWPLPQGWLVTGFATAGDERTGSRATVVALSGPNPAGGPAEMLLVSEDPGVGLGARFAGLAGPDPGDELTAVRPAAAVRYGNHEFPLWHVADSDLAAFAGEVSGHWMWLILRPQAAGLLTIDPLPLRDLRDPGQYLDLPFGARSPLLPR